MKTKLIRFFNLIKKDKQAKILTIMGIILLFIFTLGYSLSMFTTSQIIEYYIYKQERQKNLI